MVSALATPTVALPLLHQMARGGAELNKNSRACGYVPLQLVKKRYAWRSAMACSPARIQLRVTLPTDANHQEQKLGRWSLSRCGQQLAKQQRASARCLLHGHHGNADVEPIAAIMTA